MALAIEQHPAVSLEVAFSPAQRKAFLEDYRRDFRTVLVRTPHGPVP